MPMTTHRTHRYRVARNGFDRSRLIKKIGAAVWLLFSLTQNSLAQNSPDSAQAESAKAQAESAKAQGAPVKAEAPVSPLEPLGIIEGRVVDKQSKQEIVGAKLQVLIAASPDKLIGAVTDIDGGFQIKNVPVGTHRLKITATDYKTLIKTDVSVVVGQSSKFTVELKPDIARADEIVVTADALFSKSDDAKVSTNSLSQEEIRRAPGSVEDVSRMVQSLPGVAVASDTRNDLIVRGGSPAENFTMVDGIEVPNINHFGTQGTGGGPIGMINVDFLEDVTFSAGGFGTKYGDRLSSVMDVRYRDGDKNRFGGKFDLGIAGAGFILEGPIQQGKSSFIVSARKSYLDLILGATGLSAVPNYSNFNLKATYDISPSHRLALIGLGGVDDIYIKGDLSDDEASDDRIRNNGWQAVLGLTHKWVIGNGTYLQTSLSGDLYRFFTDSDSAGVRSTFRNSSYEGEVLLRSDLSHRFSPVDALEGGITARSIQNNNEIFIAPRTDDFGVARPAIDYTLTANAVKVGAYAQYTRQLLERLSLTGGVRYDALSYLNTPGVFSPRLSASYNVLRNLKVNAAYGTYHQAPPMVWLMFDERNRDLKQIQARHTVAGLEYYPAEDIKVTVEVFDKQYQDYAASVENPQVSYANVGADFGTIGLERLTSASTGNARGVEFFIQKKFTSNFYGMLNYSYSQLRFSALDGVERAGTYDYRNVFTAIAGYKLTDNLELSGKYRYVGGRPYTPFDDAASGAANQGILDFTQVNAVRLPEYQRLDFRVDYKLNFGGWSMITFLDFQNTLNRQNISFLTWNEKKGESQAVYQWQFLPAGGIKVLF